MLDPDTATETELRRFLNDNGVNDWEWREHIHPDSKALRDAGFNAQADLLDDYFKKYTLNSMGEHRVYGMDELKAKAQEILNAK